MKYPTIKWFKSKYGKKWCVCICIIIYCECIVWERVLIFPHSLTKMSDTNIFIHSLYRRICFAYSRAYFIYFCFSFVYVFTHSLTRSTKTKTEHKSRL